MSAPFEKVPTEMLHKVCSILDAVHPRSLWALARASKHCYSVASRVLYRTVKIAIADHPETPFHFLDALETRLFRDHAFQHVRRLILCVPKGLGINGVDWPYASLDPYERAFEADIGLQSCWDIFGAEFLSNDELDSIAEHDWEPVIRLIERLPGLVDLYWVRHERLPLRLLNVLDSRTKPCRLHHYTFNLASSTETPLTPYEHALITSPSLYSIGNLDFNTPAFESARNIQSPNLRRVYLSVNDDYIQRENISGHEHRKRRAPVPREVVHIEGGERTPLPFSMVQAEAFGDFSALRVLKMHHYVDAETLPPPSDFPSLDTLTYTCNVDQNITPQIWDKLAAFLHNLPRLTTLDISYWDRSISFTPALNQNLRTLELETWSTRDGPRLRDDQIHRLADLCPHLETVSLELPRRLARLRELHLLLTLSPPNRIQTPVGGSSEATFDTVIEAWFDEQDAQYLKGSSAPYRQGHVRDVLINRAVDEGLVRAIVQIISDTKLVSLGQVPSVPLERLKLRTIGGTYFPCNNGRHLMLFYQPPMEQFLRALDRKWLVQRDVRDDAREVLHAHEIRWFHDMNLELKIKMNDVPDFLYWFGIWRRIWSLDKEGVVWWKAWKSRPLALGDGGNEEAD